MPVKKPLFKALTDLTGDIDIQAELSEEIRASIVEKSFEDTGDLKRSYFVGERGVYTDEPNTEKFNANEFGTVKMTGSAAIRRTLREIDYLIAQAIQKRKSR